MADREYKVLSTSEILGYIDTRDEVITKADALCALITGDGFERFQQMNDEIQSNIIWAISGFLHQAREANDAINDHNFATRKA
jgi:hypothetical protein